MATFYIDHELADYNLKLGGSLAWAGRLAEVGGFKEQPSYAVVNIYTEWTPPAFENVSLRFGVDNLFDKTYFERAGYGDGPRASPSRSPPIRTAGRRRGSTRSNSTSRPIRARAPARS